MNSVLFVGNKEDANELTLMLASGFNITGYTACSEFVIYFLTKPDDKPKTEEGK